MTQQLILGCIADDFTGAGDAASFLAEGGMKTILVNGIPQTDEIPDSCQAIVIALKTRTQETASAVADTLAAAAWLKAKGARQLYIKYCSTFDSTPKGNIGPIMDALLETYDEKCSILCPALPVNGRTVKNGKLYVNGVPLNESSMKDHPLTPMWDSEIAVLMREQSKYPCYVQQPQDEQKYDDRAQDEQKQGGRAQDEQKQDGRAQNEQAQDEQAQAAYAQDARASHYYIVPDFENEHDAKRIVAQYGHLGILSGSSGLCCELARKYCETRAAGEAYKNATEGKGLLLAGSCSVATRAQIRSFQEQGGPSLKIDPAALVEGRQTFDQLWDFIATNKDKAVCVYSSDTPEAVRAAQKDGKENLSAVLEGTMAELARKALDAGYTRIIVAGGETSGAVTLRLGFDSYFIADSVAPGVPIMIPLRDSRVRLVLKSGNFGQEDFFIRALGMTED